MNTLKKYLAFLFVIILLVSTSACQQSESSVDNPKDNTEEVYELLIPASYMKYSGLESDELCNSIISKGKTYATDATVVDNGAKILATQKQIDNLIKNNNDNTLNFVSSFEDSDEKYKFIGSNDYSVMEFHCDEHLDSQKLFSTIAAVSSTYAFNNILYNKNPEWDVIIKVVNCHTGKTVIEGSILKDDMTINKETWENSYVN